MVLKSANTVLLAAVLACAVPAAPAAENTSGPVGYSALMEDFCRGRLEAVIEAIDQVDVAGPAAAYPFLRLRARTAGERFVKHFAEGDMSGRALTEAERAELDELSDDCARAFEAALAGAPTRFERACLAAAWWHYRSRMKFGADSDRMREFFPDQLQASAEPLRAKIDAQALELRNAFRSLLDRREESAAWPEEIKGAFADSMAAEFSVLAAVDIPDAVFSDLLENLPAFVLQYMPLPERVGDSPVRYRHTMRWHLWNAIVCRLPGKTERRAIDSQVKQSADSLEDGVDAMMKAAGLDARGAAYAARFLGTYEDLKDNRSIPYFKRVMPEHEISRRRAALEEGLQQRCGSWEGTLADIDRLWGATGVAGHLVPEGQTSADLLERSADDYIRTAYILVFTNTVRRSQPAHVGGLPGEFIQLSSGSLNRNWVWSFTIGKVVPFDDLPRGDHFWRVK